MTISIRKHSFIENYSSQNLPAFINLLQKYISLNQKVSYLEGCVCFILGSILLWCGGCILLLLLRYQLFISNEVLFCFLFYFYSSHIVAGSVYLVARHSIHP